MMLKDLESAVRKIAQFLSARITEEQVARIAHKTSFASVTKKIGNTPLHRQGSIALGNACSTPVWCTFTITVHFTNTGKYGTWKKEFTVEQNEMFDQWIKKGLHGFDDIKFKYE